MKIFGLCLLLMAWGAVRPEGREPTVVELGWAVLLFAVGSMCLIR